MAVATPTAGAGGSPSEGTTAGTGGAESIAGSTSTGGSGGSGGASGAGVVIAAGGQAAMAEPIQLGLYNVVSARIEPGYETLGPALQRVELPPRFTLAARVPMATRAVRFSIDDTTRIDSQAPFRYDEDASGQATPWAAAIGVHHVTAAAYADAAAQGPPLTQLDVQLEVRGAGMDAGFTPTSAAINSQWLSAHLNDVMQAKTFTGSVGTMPYRLYTPEKYDASVAYPLLVFLHGRGERGVDNRVAIFGSQLFHGPLSIVSPNEQHDFPSFVVVPQCSDMPDTQEWAHWVGSLGKDGSYQQAPDPSPAAVLVKELIASIQRAEHIDKGRIYLAGESMGGFGTWEFTTRWPEIFAAGVPMAGYSDRSKVSLILKIPFWVFHGGADGTNPVAGSRAMTKAINDAGGSAKYTEYPGLDHAPTFNRAWSQEAELLPWIYSQRSTTSATPAPTQ